MSNRGDAAVQLGFYEHHPNGDVASRFDVAPGGRASASVTPEPSSGAYDVEIHGPNGFYRHAAGTAPSGAPGVDATLALVGGDHNPRLKLTVRNHGNQSQTVSISGVGRQPLRFALGRNETKWSTSIHWTTTAAGTTSPCQWTGMRSTRADSRAISKTASRRARR